VPRAASRAARPGDRAALAFCLGALALFVLYPSGRLLWEALRQWELAALLSGNGWAAVRNTFWISIGSVAGAALLGIPLAIALARWQFPFARLLGVVAYLPFTMPPLVGTLAFYYLIGRDGLLPRFLQHRLGWEDAAIPGPWAILAIHTYSFYVFFYAMVSPAVASLDHAQAEAARTLGAGPRRTFLRVTLPQLMPAILGASLLTFMSSAASFSAPYFFGGDFPMLSVRIFEERGAHNTAAALTLTVALAAVSLLGVLLFSRRGAAGGRAAKGTPTPLRGRAGRRVAGLLAWCGAACLLLPHATIVWLSFVDYAAWHTELVPTAFTLDNYRALAQSATTLNPIRSSLWMSALGTVLAVAVGLPAAYLIARGRPGGRTVNLLVMLPWALPGTVIAMMLIVAFNERWLPLYNTVWILPLAYFVRALPLMTRTAAAAIEPFDATLLEAARTLGATPRHAFFRVVLPLIAPAVCAGMAMVFATSLGEFVASILLYLPANLPISVRINMEWRADVGIAFAYSVLLMAIVGVTFYLSRRVSGRVL
jgi:iron(III) transport system permease protein